MSANTIDKPAATRRLRPGSRSESSSSGGRSDGKAKPDSLTAANDQVNQLFAG